MQKANYIKDDFLITEMSLEQLNQTGVVYNEIFFEQGDPVALCTNQGNSTKELCDNLIGFIIKKDLDNIIGGLCDANITQDEHGSYVLYGRAISFPKSIKYFH